MTASVLPPRQLASLFFFLFTAPGIQLGARAASDCTNGFISLDRLVGLTTTNINVLESRQIVFPNINFTCNGVITELAVLARRNTTGDGGTLYPDLQVWRRNDSNGVYNRVGGTPLSVENEDDIMINVHTLNSSLEFQTGDVFGIFQPRDGDSRLRVVLQTNSGPESLSVDTGSEEVPPDTFSSTDPFTDYPLVVITADPQECVSGSASLERVQAVRDRLNGAQLNVMHNRQSVSPQINFTCDGKITKWIIGGLWDNGNDFYPELQVWRRVNGSTPNSYHRVGNTVIAVAEKNSDRRVYEYPVDPPLPVEAGDVLGIYQPPTGDSRLRVWYEIDAGPVTLYQIPQRPRSTEDFPEPAGGMVQSHSSLPLVTVEIDPMVALTSATAVSTSPVVTETPGGGVDMPTSFPAAAVGAGVAVGVVVAIATLAAVVVVMVLMYRNKKRKKDPNPAPNTSLHNPVYESGRDQPAMSNHQVISGPANDFASDETGLENGQRKLSADSSEHYLRNPVYTTAQPDGAFGDDNNATVSSRVYADVMYVPTLEQRRAVEKSQELSEESLYASIYSRVKNPQQPLQFFEQEEIYWEPAPDSANLYSQLANHKYREIPRSQISTTFNLGSGQFGTVDKGVWLAPWGPTDVAVKMLKEGSTEEDRVKFLQEAAIMGQFFHPNVVKLLGVVTVGEQSMIVEEFLPHGALREYLHTLRPVPGELVAPDVVGLCLKFCQEIASGMQYLSKKAYIHRDLSARNILVSQDRVCKVADFGMARDIVNTDYYTSSGGQVPIKWTAPEALNFRKYSTASDVWSFGVVMYEIWSLGHKPFEGYTNAQAFKKVLKGFRLPPPPGCPRAVYQLMINCWHPESHSRPSFSAVTTYLSQSESSLLSWSETDAASHSNATTLGAGLENGHNMYLDLQESYLQPA